MTGVDVKNKIGELLKKEIEGSNMSWYRAEEIANFIQNVIKDDISEDELKKVIPTLDDNFKELNKIVLQLL